jgi:hypothetical protein
MKHGLRIIVMALIVAFGLVAVVVAGDWQQKDMGVGIYDESKGYDKVLLVVQRGALWSQKQLYDRGYFASGDKKFGAWLVGPPVKNYLDRFGIPLYGYKYRLTEPSGKSAMFGPASFYEPGFTTVFINASGPTGLWKIDFLLWTRATNQDNPIGSMTFTMEP